MTSMIPIFAMLGALVAVGLVLWLLDRRQRRLHPQQAQADDERPVPAADAACAADADGCTLSDVCPTRQAALAGLGDDGEPVYYDDQELDDFRGRAATDYTPDEEEQWREVLYTLQPSDLMGWELSVRRRGLVMPQAVRDEFIMLAGEQLGRRRAQ